MTDEMFAQLEARCLQEIERNERIRCHRVADRWRRDLERYRKEHLKRRKYDGNMECSNQREGE